MPVWVVVVDGAFNDKARAIIYTAAEERCIGCGRTDLTAQHRRARGMGGTSELSIGHPANGLGLCGDGTRGCHGWTEHHPRLAALLGWRMVYGEHALEAPFWQRLYGWRKWQVEPDGFISVLYVDPDELDRPDERQAALAEFMADLERRRAFSPTGG